MKKIITIISLVFLAGCSHTTLTSKMIKDPDLVAKGNTINLKDFDVKIQVNDDLQYVDQIKTLNVKGTEETETYLYTYLSEGKAKRIITVEIKKLSCDNCTYAYWGQPGTILKGKLKLEQNEEPYGIHKFSDTQIAKYITDSAIRIGFILPNNVIERSYSYLLDKKNKNRILVTYYEDADEFGLYPRMNLNEVTQDQSVKIQGYLKRCLEAIKVNS